MEKWSCSINCMIMRIRVLLIAFLLSMPCISRSQTRAHQKNDTTYSGYERDNKLGGPRSVQNKLQVNNSVTQDKGNRKNTLSTKWYRFKKEVNEAAGIRFGINYSMDFVGASEKIRDSSSVGAYGGVLEFDFYQRIIGKNSRNKGSLNLIVDWRHAYPGSIPPADLHLHTGSYTSVAVEFTEYSIRPIELFYHQIMLDGKIELAVGKIDPFNFFTQHPLINGMTDFQNSGFSISPAAAWPSSGTGMVVALDLLKSNNFIMKIGVHDVIGDRLEKGEVFNWGENLFDGRFLQIYEMVWARSEEEELTNSVSVTYWQADPVEEINTFGVEEVKATFNEGVAMNVNWLFGDNYQTFMAIGLSNGGGSAGLAKKSVAIGGAYAVETGDAIGIGVSWIDPVVMLRSQMSSEVYYRYRVSRFTAVTPTVQWILNPSFNPEYSSLLFAGIRLRCTF